MADYAALKKKVDELAERVWDFEGIKARVNKMTKEGIPKKKLDSKKLLAKKDEILDRVQLRAEEYNLVFKNCAKSTTLALMEEFGLGNMEIIKALTVFPGIGGTGNICGGITGVLIAFGLFYDIIENVILGHRLNPGESEQAMIEFIREKGFEKCGLPPGLGARTAADFMINSLQ
jgi:hypothetical protein